MRSILLLCITALTLASCSSHMVDAKVQPVAMTEDGVRPVHITEVSDMFETGDTILLSPSGYAVAAPYVIVEMDRLDDK